MIAADRRAGGAAGARRVPHGRTPSGPAIRIVTGRWTGAPRWASVVLAVLLAGCAGLAPLRDPSGSRPAGGASSVTAGPARARELAAGEAIPDFRAPALGGGQVVWSGRPGRPTVLVVWASWCPHCRQELPLYARVATEFPSVALVSVTTSIGRQGGPTPQEMVELARLTSPVAVDDDANTLARALGVSRYPTVFWVGSDGRVRATTWGELGETLIREGFQTLARSS